MKRYIHNPTLFQEHFAGQGLPAFKGQRMQRGRGRWFNKLRRYAVPLLKTGLKAASPHISKAASNAASNLAQQVLPNSPVVQRVASDLTGRLTNHALDVVTKERRLQNKRQRETDHTTGAKRGRTTQNIFA